MVSNMRKNKKKEITEFLKKLLSEGNVYNYYLADFSDDDINFIVTPKLEGKEADVLFNFSFIMYCTGGNTLTIYCPVIYCIKEKDSIMYMLNAINNINNKIAVGKIYMSDNNTTVTYINRILFNNIMKELTPHLFSEYINSYLFCCMEFYEQLKGEFVNE